jgi:dynein heavy chain
MFNKLVEHCIKITRIMKHPYGNGIIISTEGSGIPHINKLAVYLCNYDLFEVKILPNYILEDWHSDLK